MAASHGSPLAMAEWIEIHLSDNRIPDDRSPLAMAEWIEITSSMSLQPANLVSASDGGVD